MISAGLSFVTAAQAQTSAQVTGSLVNETGNPVEFATVSLLRAKDSSIVKGTLGSDAGRYQFEKVQAGNYIISATSMGYTKSYSKPFAVNGRAVNVPALTMPAESKALATVNVTATRPTIERKPDRMVMNVENSILATGNNALEILEQAPGVTVDRDDVISLQGKTGVTVMINDKLTYLSSTQLAALLRSTDGTQIQSIEVITNPSSKYDAAGNSGIINIKLKKNRVSGTNGSITAGAGYGKNWRNNTSINLNHKEGDWNFFGSFSRGDIKRENMMNINRVIQADDTTYFRQYINMASTIHYNNYRFGADYNTSKRNTIGFVVSGDHSGGHDVNDNVTNIDVRPVFGIVDTINKTPSTIDPKYRNIAFNLNDRFQIDTLGQEISVDIDYSKFRNNSLAYYKTDFFLPDGSTYNNPLVIANETPSTITINTQKVDYTKSLSKTLKLEAGAKFSSVKTDNDLQAQVDSTGSGLINDAGRTNHFIYDEKIKAGYFNLSKQFKTTSVQFGLRAEHTSSTGNLVTENKVVKRDYLNLFPTLFINQKLGKKHEMGFSYSRRIDRPSYEDLNPFVYYLDQYTYSQGNPFLNPQYTNSFELNYTYNKSINVTFNYSKTTDSFTEIILTDTARKATYQTNLNFKEQNYYSVNINSPFTFFKWWSGNVNFNGFYNDFKNPGLQGADLSKGKFAFVFKTQHTFILPKQFKAELMSYYQSSLVYGIYDIRPQHSIDAGVSRSFANKKLNIKLAMSDVFNTRRNNLSANYQATQFEIRQQRETRITRITLTYNFGNSKFKGSNRRTGADDEANRVKSRN
ncbi:outer membrane beta-barrel protein [Mucilaginibacter limnophilus]|nr:outer membrane beta-barrel protein [Mucilaginibacter limnophilus]